MNYNQRVARDAFVAGAVIIMLLIVAEMLRFPPRIAAPLFLVAFLGDILIMIVRLTYTRTPETSVARLPAVPPVIRIFVTTEDTAWRRPNDNLQAYIMQALLDDLQELANSGGLIVPLNVTTHQISELHELLGNFVRIDSTPVYEPELQAGDRVIVIHGDISSYLVMTSVPLERIQVEAVPDIWYDIYTIL